MNKFLFTKIFLVLGLVIGALSASNYGVRAILEIAGYALPYALAGSVIGLILDLIQRMFSKKND